MQLCVHVAAHYYNECEVDFMDREEKRKIADTVISELRWMREHPELNLPQWYINLVIVAEYRLIHRDYIGALHDIRQAITGRKERM